MPEEGLEPPTRADYDSAGLWLYSAVWRGWGSGKGTEPCRHCPSASREKAAGWTCVAAMVAASQASGARTRRPPAASRLSSEPFPARVPVAPGPRWSGDGLGSGHGGRERIGAERRRSLGASPGGQKRQGDQCADHGSRGCEGGGGGHGVDERAVGGVDQLGASSAAELRPDLVRRADTVARRLGRSVGEGGRRIAH